MSWFSGLFRKRDPRPSTVASGGPADGLAQATDLPLEDPFPRKVVAAPLIREIDPEPPMDEVARVRAELDTGRGAIVLRVNRTLLHGWSWQGNTIQDAYAGSPLAEALFQVGPVHAVTIRDNVVEIRVTLDPDHYEEMARCFGTTLKRHLEEGFPVVFLEIFDGLPAEEELSRRVVQVLDREINPMVRDHGGAVQLEAIRGNTVFVRMEGGCQGCAASDATLGLGVEKKIREAVPEIGAIVDVTEHAEGLNPYYR